MNKKTTTPRQPKGIPVGGQFTTKTLGEADVILAEAHSAARRAVEKAYEAGVAEGQRRQRGEPHRTLAEVMDLSGFTFEDALVDIEGDPTFADDLSGIDMNDPWTVTEHTPAARPTLGSTGTVECYGCDGTGASSEWQGSRTVDVTCPSCNGERTLPGTPAGLDQVEVPGWGTFHRGSGDVRPDYPSAMRFEADRVLTEEDMRGIAQLVGYRWAATLGGEPLGWFVRDSDRSFVLAADTSKSRRTDLDEAFNEFEEDLDGLLVEGSPVRSTNRSGPGTKGTRLVDGLGAESPNVAVYYNDVTVAHTSQSA